MSASSQWPLTPSDGVSGAAGSNADVNTDVDTDATSGVTALYQAHAVGLIRLAIVMLGDRGAAEDVVQDAFFGLYRHWSRLTDPANALSYARSAVLNGCRNILRQRGRPRHQDTVVVASESAKVPTPRQVFSIQFGIVVGDSLTGKTLATFTPPARTTFLSVSAAANDRTFAVFAVTSSTGSFELSMKDGRPTDSITLTGSWYKVRLAPGTAHPADLNLLPIKPWSWSLGVPPAASSGQVDSMALSEAGQELAVAGIPEVPAAGKPQDWQEVKVFSVATGKLLHDWTANDPMATIGTALPSTIANIPTGTPALTWVDGDQAVTLATSHETVTKTSATMTGTVRRLNMAGLASGNLMTDSTVIWSGTLPWDQSKGCFQVDGWPPLVSADGNTISCLTWDMPAKTPGHVDFDTYPLVTGRQPTLNYRAMIPPEDTTGGLDASVLWVSPSADTLIVAWGGPGLKPSTGAHFGVISHGKFTPLPLQANRAALTAMSITF